MIESVTSSIIADTSNSTYAVDDAELGKDDFLMLLVAQLENQDPLDPEDATEFTAQLAQFSALEQQFNTNDLLEQLLTVSQSNTDIERLSAVSLIGRQVEVAGPDFSYSANPIEFSFTLDSTAEAVSVQILDASGEVVAVLPETNSAAGLHSLTWDGTGLDGQPVPLGDYSLQVERTDGEETTTVPTLISSLVNSVDLSNPSSILTTEAGDYELAEVLSVTGT